MEGPHIHYYAERIRPLIGRSVASIDGQRAHVCTAVVGRRLVEVLPHGKLLRLRFDGLGENLRLHCLMFGDIRIDAGRPGKRLTFSARLVDDPEPPMTLNLFLGAARMASESEFDPAVAARDIGDGRQPTEQTMAQAIAALAGETLADALMDQTWFPGLGNKIKNEALFDAKLSPSMTMQQMSGEQADRLAESIRNFTGYFRREVFEHGDRVALRYQVFRKKRCPDCGGNLINEKIGELQRTCHHCPSCQATAGVG